MPTSLRPLVLTLVAAALCAVEEADWQPTLWMPSSTHPLPRQGEVRIDGATWRVATVVAPVAGHPGCDDITVTVALAEGTAPAASIGLSSTVTAWDPAGYVLVPGVVYNGNRFAVLDQRWPPLWRDAAQFRADMPITFTDQPRLSQDGTPARIELDAGNATTPAIGVRTADGRGLLLVTTQRSAETNTGLTIDEDPGQRRLTLQVMAPHLRSRVPRITGFAPGDAPRVWAAGDSATVRVRCWRFPAPTLQALFDRFVEIRKDLNPATPTEVLPFSEAWRLLEAKHNTLNWDEAKGFYCHDATEDPATRKALWASWQLGWVSGGINTLANLLQGDALSRQRALRTLDFMFTQTRAPSGLLYGNSDGTAMYSDGFRTPHPHGMTMVRKQCDGLAFGVKQLLLLRLQGEPVPSAWEATARGLADALVRTWETEHQLGQFLDIETGKILVGGSTAGAMAPAGLVRAAAYFHEPRYLAAAQAIARHFIATSLRTGVTCGGPGEALAAPDSESAFALLESLVELHQATGEAEWAAATHDLVRLCATWVVSYDYAFPAGSPMARIDARSTGAVVANTQNKHGAPGLCTLSGDMLFKWWRATGDEVALDMIHDIAHGTVQYLARVDHPIGRLPPGAMCERVNLSDWEGAANVGGNIFGSSAWPEIATMLTTAEIPGIYLNTDTGRTVVFDHVQARYDAAKKVLTVHNPTAFPATVRILAESTAEAKAPLGVWTLRGARLLTVAPGASADLAP